MKDDICYLIKFGAKKHMLDLFENGNLYLNTLDYFKNLEEKGNRADKLETAIANKVFKEKDNYTLTIKLKEEIKFKIVDANLTQYQEFQGNLFCLYSIKLDDILNNNYKIDARVLEDENYSYSVLITNVSEFLSRVAKELEKREINFSWKLIKYYNPNKDNKNLTVFNKSNEFDFQKEFRIVVKNLKKKELILNIGNLKDIATLNRTEILRDLKIEYIKDVS